MLGLIIACLVSIDYDLIGEPTRYVNIPAISTNYADRFELSLRTSNVKNLDEGAFSLFIAINQTILASNECDLSIDDTLEQLAINIRSQKTGEYLAGWDFKTVVNTLSWSTKEDLLKILIDLKDACLNIIVERVGEEASPTLHYLSMRRLR